MNDKIKKVLNDLATFEDYNKRPFPAKAYRNAVKTIGSLDFEVKDVREIRGLPGIGDAIATKIEEFLKNGTFKRYEEYLASPAGQIAEIAEVKGIGMNKATEIFNAGIKSLEDLKAKCEGLEANDKIPGTSITFTNAMKIGLQFMAHTEKTRMTKSQHDEIVNPMIEAIKKIPCVTQASPAGSARRFDGSTDYTIGDIDIVVGISVDVLPTSAQKTMESLFDELLMSGSTKISGIVNKRQVDIRITKDSQFSALLLTETGPAMFNVKCRKLAIEHGWKLNEYGLWDRETGDCIARTEEDILKKLGLGWVEPKDRKNVK